ncbi:MAG: DUF21 domain-containing protein, partial [Flavobacterium sp.]|nr:DUF21 domain-containing protein [Flavobacterium sp.]
MDKEPPSISFLENLDTDLILGFAGIFALLFCTAIVSGAEVAFFSLTQKDLDDASIESPEKIKILNRLLERPKKLLATLLVANNFINIGVVILFSLIGKNLFENIASPILKFSVEVILITFLILLFGEVLPKIYANRNHVRFAKLIVFSIAVLDKLLSPISLPMRSLTIYLQNKLGKQKSNFSVDQLSQ